MFRSAAAYCRQRAGRMISPMFMQGAGISGRRSSGTGECAAPGLGFTSGMPFLLTYSTQSAWLTDAGVPLASIGLLSELTLAYKFKFLWAPFLDQYDPPLIGRSLASFFCEASSSAAGRAAFRFAGTIALSSFLVLV